MNSRNNSNHYEESTLLLVQNVHLILGENYILEDVSLEIKDLKQPGMVRGQIRGLIGPSGVGKTQLLRILAGLNQANQGTVKVTVDESGTLKSVKPGMVGVVAQHYPLFDHLTVLDNLILGAISSHLLRKEARDHAYELLNRFDLYDRANFWPAQLSGGQRQRVSILQQLMVKRFFMIMDEPFSGLDPNAIGRMLSFIEEIAHSHELNTIIIVSHDIRSVLSIADRIYILGRKFDETGNIVRGAHIIEEIDLLKIGLAWQPGIKKLPQFISLVNEIEDKYAGI